MTEQELIDQQARMGINESGPPALSVWAILELLGHVRIAGRVTEEEHFGAKLGRIDIPQPDGTITTQFFGGGSIYRMTPVSEEVARSVAFRSQPVPIHSWELPVPALQPPAGAKANFEDEDDDPDDPENGDADNF